MADFTVRIELHNADSDDYDLLHKKMEAKGFSKTIASNNGVAYKLPDAEYDYSSSTKKRGDVLDLAYGVAKSIKKNPSVLVTESKGRTWEGLKKT
ncbi:type V toxin-antitoxin system endoribonuclease antitoxin GhoS [Photorhabdus sp. SF281]|uniref:type V toxin-antitoxin system endoribonuclease antitoxin GhoS n=1 Tax=Photorhabdus sp. SF281 TaxID=3459527 RepID=UPI004043BC84